MCHLNMKKILQIVLIILSITISACAQNHKPKINVDKFEDFKKKEKFVEEPESFYPGIMDITMRPTLTEKINFAADDFKKVSLKGNPTDKDYQDIIKIGLKRFDGIYLDTEDRERVCGYFEELMNIVGLQSSGGILNNYMYGFDPNQFKK